MIKKKIDVTLVRQLNRIFEFGESKFVVRGENYLEIILHRNFRSEKALNYFFLHNLNEDIISGKITIFVFCGVI